MNSVYLRIAIKRPMVIFYTADCSIGISTPDCFSLSGF